MNRKSAGIGVLLLFFVLVAFNTLPGKTEIKPVVSTADRVTLNIGDKAPEIYGKDPEGNSHRLSELRGNIVLVDFWASWCGPCRRENPNVVTAYNKYHKAKFKKAKGFEVFSYALENPGQIERWKKAILQDNLYWPYHVSDFMGWKSPASNEYGVYSIPSNFLLDKDGIIIAKNLRGPALHRELDKLITGF